MNFSQWLQEEMQKNNLTEYRIAKLSGVHQTTIKNLLSGTKPQIGTEEKIKRAIERINAEKQKKPDPQTGAGTMPPKEYSDLNAANRAIVDRLIADLAKSQSENPPSGDSQA